MIAGLTGVMLKSKLGLKWRFVSMYVDGNELCCIVVLVGGRYLVVVVVPE